MVKNHPNYFCRHDKRMYTLEGLYQTVKARKRFTDQGPIIGSITAGMHRGVRVRIVFVRDHPAVLPADHFDRNDYPLRVTKR